MEKLGKKGVFFTIIAVFLVTVLLSIAAHQGIPTRTQSESSAHARVELANNYVQDLKQQYFKDAVYASSFNALDLLSEYVAANGFFSSKNEFDYAFKELVLTGKYGSWEPPEMADHVLLKKFSDIEAKSKEVYSIDTWINITRDGLGEFVPEKAMEEVGININHTNASGPFKVEVDLNISFNVSLPEIRTSWVYQNETIRTVFGISQLNDPLYLGQAGYENAVTEASTENGEWDADSLFEHYDKMTYRHNSGTLDFLMRYYFGDDCACSSIYGIESVVNPDLLPAEDLQKTYTDWCFYSIDKCPRDSGFESGSLWTIDDERFSSAFKLDSALAVEYGIPSSQLVEVAFPTP